jgi:hypothetical protein
MSRSWACAPLCKEKFASETRTGCRTWDGFRRTERISCIQLLFRRFPNHRPDWDSMRTREHPHENAVNALLFSRDSFSRIRNPSRASTLWICFVSLHKAASVVLLNESKQRARLSTGNHASSGTITFFVHPIDARGMDKQILRNFSLTPPVPTC